MTTISAIRAHQFVGNAHSDSLVFDAIDMFAADENNSVPERAEALRIMAKKGMGLEGNEAGDNVNDWALVQEFMEQR